jgi:hypothetical protein
MDILESETMVDNTKPLFGPNQEETRTSATVFKEDLQKFKSIARLKFDTDPMNNAWKEAVKLFIRENKHLLKETYDNIPEQDTK